MTWEVTDQGFRMVLSPKVPDGGRDHVEPVATTSSAATASLATTSPPGPSTPEAAASSMSVDEH